MRKDKVKIIGEEISDERIKSFLDLEPADNTPSSLYKLLKAYRGLRSDDFARFVNFFTQQGFDLLAKDQNGNDFISIISNHKNAASYLAAVQRALN